MIVWFDSLPGVHDWSHLSPENVWLIIAKVRILCEECIGSKYGIGWYFVDRGSKFCNGAMFTPQGVYIEDDEIATLFKLRGLF